MDRRDVGQSLVASLLGMWCVLAMAGVVHAGTTGKIAGRIVDGKKQPLAGVNMAVPDARAGALTDLEGRYSILNIPAGTYDIRIALLGYRAVIVQKVVVSADETTPLDYTLVEAPVALEEVVVSAQRSVINSRLTSTVATVSREEIRSLPVQELQDIVNLQAGVVEGHFRGGRIGEVQYQVDGVTVNNPFDNASSLRIDRSLLEEVQVVSGTFDAEYGQAMSGVVNAVLRRGTDQFRWDAEILNGAFAYRGGERRRVDFGLHPGGQQNYQLTTSGPMPVANTFFLVNVRRYSFDDYLYARRRFAPWIEVDPDTNRRLSSALYKVFIRPDGDGSEEPLGYTREWSGAGKLTNRSLKNIEINYGAVWDRLDGRKNNWAFRFNPEGLSKQHTFSIVHGLDWTHTLSPKAFYQISVRQNLHDYKDLLYDDVSDSLYDLAGPPTAVQGYENEAVVQGVEFTRFKQRTDAIVLKTTLTSQWNRDQQMKAGAEFQWPEVQFGAPGTLVYASDSLGQQRLVRKVNELPEFPSVQTYHPYVVGAFVQNETDLRDLRVRAGLRLDYLNPRAGLPSDLANPANAIEGAPLSHFQAASRKLSISPRLGVSYPVTDKAALFFAYGHFYQYPALTDILRDADYTLLRDLQAGIAQYRVMGNPDIKPERTIQYQFGYKQALADWLGLEANMFYKDVRDLLGVEFVDTYNGATYARAANADFGNVLGVTVSLDQRQVGLFSTSLDYTWQRAQGNSSDPRETATRASAGEDPRPRVVPFDWDQRHTLNVTVSAGRTSNFLTSAIVRVASGNPYTPEIETGFGSSLEKNSGRKPMSMVVDVRGEKSLKWGSTSVAAFARVFNAFDTRYFNGVVFGTSGSPYYSRFSGRDQGALADPTRFYGPRRIEIGITTSSQGS